VRGHLARDVDVLEAARAIFFAALGARISWANGLLDREGCRASIETSIDLLFCGIGSRARYDAASSASAPKRSQ
jgi:hypothetical protein